MNGVSAVVTTGIYCRPGCGARPLPANVRPFPNPAAAEAAGFRACLRCRPYRSDPTLSWAGTDLVCRAVQLILDGALDGGTEAQLGARLGISPRHLRRLFEDQLGATPDQVARSRRAHFARRLLDDTDLSITDIAFAAGFGSVRQFNRASQDVFRATPGQLRARRRRDDRLVADGGLTLRLGFEPPLAWDPMLAYLKARAIAGVEHVSGDSYRRTVGIDGDPGVIELSPGGADHVLLRAHLPHWEGLIHHVQRARRIFNLDGAIAGATAHLAHDAPGHGPPPTMAGTSSDMAGTSSDMAGPPSDMAGPPSDMAALVAAEPGLRPPGTWDPFETGVRAIVGQQVSVAGANTLMARLVARHGTPVPGLGSFGLTHLFPSAETLADADLSGLGLTTARESAVRAFAQAVVGGTVELDRSRRLDQFEASMTATVGLGPWTAQYLALRMGEPDAFPAGDLGLRRALATMAGHPVTPAEAAAVALAWRPYRAFAAIHLWLPSRQPMAV